jgi:hypothetical protein
VSYCFDFQIKSSIKKSFIDWILSNAIKRLPILGESEYETLITGADSYTPDGRLILNESAEVSHSDFDISQSNNNYYYLD